MSKIRVVPYRDLKRIAERAGFAWVRCAGSHNVFRHPDSRTITIPDHGSRDIVRPLIRKIIHDLGLTPDQYHKSLDE